MAKRLQQRDKPAYTCRECRNSYDWHDKNWLGEPFLCRCKFYKEGKFSLFLSDPQCNNFELRNGEAEQR